MTGLKGLGMKVLDGEGHHWWRKNGLKGLDMRDLDVKGFEPAGGE